MSPYSDNFESLAITSYSSFLVQNEQSDVTRSISAMDKVEGTDSPFSEFRFRMQKWLEDKLRELEDPSLLDHTSLLIREASQKSLEHVPERK
jgi:hypothetical protein